MSPTLSSVFWAWVLRVNNNKTAATKFHKERDVKFAILFVKFINVILLKLADLSTEKETYLIFGITHRQNLKYSS